MLCARILHVQMYTEHIYNLLLAIIEYISALGVILYGCWGRVLDVLSSLTFSLSCLGCEISVSCGQLIQLVQAILSQSRPVNPGTVVPIWLCVCVCLRRATFKVHPLPCVPNRGNVRSVQCRSGLCRVTFTVHPLPYVPNRRNVRSVFGVCMCVARKVFVHLYGNVWWFR